MENILFIDVTSYNIAVPEESRILRREYFQLKQYVRKHKINGIDLCSHSNTRSYSIGLLRIATILKHNGYSVKYVEHREIDLDCLSILLKDIDIVAFSAVTPTIPICAELCRKIKNLSHEITVAIGGAHINVAKQYTMSKYPCFDVYSDGFDLDGAAKVVSVPAKSLQLPEVYADYSILPHPLSEYVLNTFSTLGCIYKCDYCQDHLIPYYENHDITGIDHFIGNVPRGSIIHYFDSVLGVKRERTKMVCDALIKKEHGFLLSCDARAEMITPEVVKMLEAAGFVEISLGMEIADDDILSANNRNLKYTRLVKAFETIRKYSNIYISVYNAVGIPGSTVSATTKSRNKLERLLIDDYIDDIKSCVYVPYPIDGKNYEERGVIIENNNWACYDRQSFPVYRLNNMTSQEIWDEMIKLLRVSVEAWMTKYGINSLEELPEEYCIEYLNERNGINNP